jgi:site-specific DNA-cytosine methylase
MICRSYIVSFDTSIILLEWKLTLRALGYGATFCSRMSFQLGLAVLLRAHSFGVAGDRRRTSVVGSVTGHK